MTVKMIDSAAVMRTMVRQSPEEWEAAARCLWEPMKGMVSFIPGGPELSLVHTQNFGFGPSVSGEQVLAALSSLEQADAWGRIERALTAGLEKLSVTNPTLTMPDLRVLLVLGDPTSAHFMDEIRGLSAFGGISGYIVFTIWPTDEVLGRLEGIALHELHHNVRYSPGGVAWNPQTVTVGEHVVAEGLADLFAVELAGEQGFTHFVSRHTRGSDEVFHRVCEGLDVTGMQHFVAWVLGDASARVSGAKPVGLPTGAGYAAGVRIVSSFLEATGQSAAEAVSVPSAEILAVAFPRLGLQDSA